MNIPIPKDPNKKDIFDYGFDKNLNVEIDSVESTSVYDQINDRMSGLIQSGQKISWVVPGLITEEL